MLHHLRFLGAGLGRIVFSQAVDTCLLMGQDVNVYRQMLMLVEQALRWLCCSRR